MLSYEMKHFHSFTLIHSLDAAPCNHVLYSSKYPPKLFPNLHHILCPSLSKSSERISKFQAHLPGHKNKSAKNSHNVKTEELS